MRIDIALYQKKMVESRKEAQYLIEEGAVFRNGIVITKASKEVKDDDVLEVKKRRKFVGRGGEKMEGLLIDIYGNEENICAHIEGKRVLDIGSSTGGFTDCMLYYGAKKVIALDVGTAQLHEKLKNDTRVISLENTDIRDYPSTDSTEIFDYIVADLSFISLTTLLSKIFSLGDMHTTFFLLYKPQFEVGFGNTKKGIVKNEKQAQDELQKTIEKVKEMNNKEITIFHSVIKGGDGNQEYFLWVRGKNNE